jgi:hypothetical protein
MYVGILTLLLLVKSFYDVFKNIIEIAVEATLSLVLIICLVPATCIILIPYSVSRSSFSYDFVFKK